MVALAFTARERGCVLRHMSVNAPDAVKTRVAQPRPDDCECLHPEQAIPCFSCHMAGFDDPNPTAGVGDDE